jgi:nucleotide sugar dehydrogenase
MSFKIGVVGNGFVGSAMVAGFLLNVEDVLIYDTDPRKRTHTLSEIVDHADCIFLCLPTPMMARTGKIDLSIMMSVVDEINQIKKDKNPLVVIKSTVVPGTVEKFAEDYPDMRFVFNPEFLTERKARLDFINTSRIILGGAEEDVDFVEKIYRQKFPHTPIIKTDFSTAQLIKYMANCFFATKVSFMNEMKQISDAVGANWDQCIEGFITDGRIGNSHIDVPGHDGSLGFGGKCFPKDLNGLINKAEEVGVSPDVMRATWKKNLEVRNFHDWNDIEGAVSEES